MGLFDERKVNTATLQANPVGQGKDMLYGWLLGRAGADLGLAQALSGGDTQGAEQLIRLEENLVAQIQELQNQQEVRSQLLKSRDEALNDLRTEIQAFTKRIGRLESTTQQTSQMVKVGQGLPSERFGRDVAVQQPEEKLGAKIQVLQSQIGMLAASEAERAQQLVSSLKSEIAGLKADLIEQQHPLQPTDSLIKGIEESLQAKIQEIHNRLAGEQARLEGRETELREFKSELQGLVQRQEKAESVAQQAHALVSSQTKIAAELREGFERELAALRAQLDERQGRDSVLQGLEEKLGARIQDLEHQVGQKLSLLDRGDAELRALKAEVQSLARRMVQNELSAQRSQPAAAGPVRGSMVTAPGSAPLRDQGQSLNAENPPLRKQVSGGESPAPNRVTQSDSQGDAEREQFKQLQERMSVEIDRVRAQLKERSGRWKVRR